MNAAARYLEQIRRERGAFFVSRLILKAQINAKQLEVDTVEAAPLLEAIKKAAGELGYEAGHGRNGAS